MIWTQFVNLFKQLDDGDDLNITFSFSDSSIVEPSFFTRFNHYFISDINETMNRHKISLIVPKHSKFLASFVLYKVFYGINTGRITAENIMDKITVGTKIRLFDAVVSVTQILNPDSEDPIIYVKALTDKNDFRAWPLSRLPKFTVVPDNTRLTGPIILERAIDKWKNIDRTDSLFDVSMSKALRDKTMIIVGPAARYKKIFSTATVNEKSVTDYLSIAYLDSKCDVKSIAESSIHYDIIICSDAYGAYYLLSNSEPGAIDTVYFDISDNACSEDYFQWTERIESFENVSVVFFINENYTFDLNYFLDRDYSVFQWKKNYITTDFIFDNDNPNSLILATFRERSFKVVVFDGSPLNEQLNILNSYQDTIISEDPALIKVHSAFSFELLGLLKNYCYVDDDFVISRKEVLSSRLRLLDDEYVRKIVAKNPLVSQLQNMSSVFLNFYSKSNPKIDYICKYLIDNSGSKICIVVPDNKNLDTDKIYDYYKEHLLSLDINVDFCVLPLSGYKDGIFEYEVAIFVGWSNKNTMKEALFSNNAFQNIVLLYDFEYTWFLSTARKWNSESYTNDFNLLDKTIDPPDDEDFFVYDLVNEVQQSDDEEKDELLDDVKRKINDNLVESKKKTIAYCKKPFLEAAMVIFSDDTYGIFERYRTFVCINDVLRGEDLKPIEKTTEDLLPGDIVVFKEKALNVLNDLALTILKANGQQACDAEARSWKYFISTAMTFLDIDEAGMIQRIKKAGCNRHVSTIKGWVKSDSIICPINKEDLVFIAKACGEYGEDLLNEIDNIYSAASTVRKAHIQAGFNLSQLLLDSDVIKSEILERYEKYGFFTFSSLSFDIDNIGRINIVKVTDVGDFQDFPSSICNIREDN